jgi:hypothetical protein
MGGVLADFRYQFTSDASLKTLARARLEANLVQNVLPFALLREAGTLGQRGVADFGHGAVLCYGL